MDLGSKNSVEKKLTQSQAVFVETQNNCALCGTELSIKVISYLENSTLKETATCPKCQITTRIKDHKMH